MMLLISLGPRNNYDGDTLLYYLLPFSTGSVDA